MLPGTFKVKVFLAMTHYPQQTESLCNVCWNRIPAELFVKDGDIWMRKTCPEHGMSELLYWRDAQVFENINAVVGDRIWCKDPVCIDGVECDECLPKTYNIMIEVTNKCNLDCPLCCSDANNPHSPDPTIEQILQRLPPTQPGPMGKFRRPNVVLFGGEPTVRKDLPQIIKELAARGYIPRLATNGVRMNDEAYLIQLKEAGLKWIILQFDGFDESISREFRGEALVEHKLKALETLHKHGFMVQLGCMVDSAWNMRQLGQMIEFVGRHPSLFWLSLYPHSAQNRFRNADSETHVSDVLAAIERQTEGRICTKDFVRTMWWFDIFNRVLKTPNLMPKLSTLPLIIVFEKDDYYPLVRLLNPLFALRKLRMALRVLFTLPRLIRFYNVNKIPPFLKFMVIEKLHNDQTIDLYEASNCHMSFMTERTFIPFDMYNIKAKKKMVWTPVRAAKNQARKATPQALKMSA